MKHLVTAILLFSLAAPVELAAQSNNWISVKALTPKTEIIVLRKNGDQVVGYLSSVTDDSVAIDTGSGSYVIARDNVKKIYHAVPRDRMKGANRGALIGGLLGLGAGIAVSSAIPLESEAMPGPAIFLAGGLLGGLVGAKRGGGKGKGALIYSEK